MKRKISKLLALLLSTILVLSIVHTEVFITSAEDAWLWPVSTSWTMSRAYYDSHTAVDILPGSESSTPIFASRAGTIIEVYDGCKNWSGASNGGSGCDALGCPDTRYISYNGKNFCNWGVGRGVTIDHGDGYVSQYAHLESINVTHGQTVSKGQLLGYMGSRGASEGKHLHFEIRCGYTSGKSFWSCTPVNNTPYGAEYYVQGAWNGIDGIHYTRDIHTHSYGAWQTVTEATCTTAGSQKRVCSCGETQTRTIPATGHAWNDGVIITESGCTNAGVKQYACTKCSATKTEALNATGHNSVIDNAVEATCIQTGLTEGSHCSKCGAIINEQQIIPALGHDNHLESFHRGCDSVSAVYVCSRCGQKTDLTDQTYIYSDWSQEKPSNIATELIEEGTQTRYRDKSTTYNDGSSTLTGWTYSGDSETIYGSWSDVGWTKTKPTETNTLKITNTKTVTDTAAYTVYNYYHYYGYDDSGSLWMSYGNGYWKNYEETSSTTPFPAEKVYDGYQAYNKSVSGKHGNLWWLGSTGSVPAVTHTEWYYQTRTETTRYHFYKWSDWSDWSDEQTESTATREVETKTVYRYKITTTSHSWQSDWSKNAELHWHECSLCGEKTELSNHIYDNDQDTTCNICGYQRIVNNPISETDFKVALESKRAIAGKEFTVSVNIANNPGFSYLELTPVFSDKLTLISAENGALISDFTRAKQYIWTSDEDVTANGTLLTLKFTTTDDTEPGNYSVGFIVRSCVNYNEQNVDLVVENGMIEIIDFIYGDVNGDREINGQDVIRLKKYLANYDYDTGTSTTEISPGADVNGDGTVNGRDVVRLKKYLANYDYDAGYSTIALGPGN